MWNVLAKKRRQLAEDKKGYTNFLGKKEDLESPKRVENPIGRPGEPEHENLGSSGARDYRRDSDSVSVKAGDRLDRLKAATEKGPASETGPFAPKEVGVSMTVIAPKPTPKPEGGINPVEGAPPPEGAPPAMDPKDHAKARDHHRDLENIYRRYETPAQDTGPQVGRPSLTQEDRKELAPEIEMGPSR